MKITFIRNKKRGLLRDRIAHVIRESVLQGALRPSEQLVEAKLAKGMNVSRAPLREAFQLLEREGFVRIIPRQGTYVIGLTPWEIAEIYVLRAALEPIAASSACRNLVPEDEQTLKGILSAMQEAADRNDHRQFYENDLRFHKEIWRLSGNRRLDDVLNALCTPLFTFRIVNSQQSTEPLTQNLGAHQAIFKAIQERDSARVKTVIATAIQGGTQSAPDQTWNEGRSRVSRYSGKNESADGAQYVNRGRG